MVRKYIVECPRRSQTFSSIYSRQAAITAVKNHAKRKHGMDVDKYLVKEVEQME
jgi:hypothetical protein